MHNDAGRLRARFLAAMGLPAATGLTLSCSSPHLPEKPVDVEVLPDSALHRSELAQGAWSVDYSERHDDGMPSCSSGNFCVAGDRDGSKGKAAAPFESCAASVPYPREPRPDVNDVAGIYEIQFAATWTAHERKAKNPKACCYSWVEPCPGGRPLRDGDGRMVVAGFVSHGPRDSMTPSIDRESAARWRRAAAFEHASIASFARFSLELLALGAPSELVARAHRAALDEIHHTELALRVARHFDGEEIELGPLPIPETPEQITPARVAIDTFRDGCVAETAAAMEARRDVASAITPIEKVALEQIATDEERHAELAFAALSWLLRTFGEPVRDALTRELSRLDREAPAKPGSVECAVALPCAHALLDTSL